ncbi:MAG: NAD(P)-binding domain-containing protein [Myxococcaceae bacterium]|nr:NAD(P)-binding domain-containing protein [Myxococcaceae bacterium]
MKIGVFGTGIVGQTLAARLVQLGHEVCMGARNSDNEKAAGFAKTHAPKGTSGTFGDAASFGELLINCTNGAGALEALKAAGDANMAGKVLIDISNPLDFSKGMPPSLLTPSTDSLGEQIQRTFPKTQVVKSLNTVTAKLMVEPASLASANHDMFMAGNDAGAKGKVKELLQSFGWRHIIDVGDITGARGLEMYLPLWVRLYGTFQTAMFNVKVTR